MIDVLKIIDTELEKCQRRREDHAGAEALRIVIGGAMTMDEYHEKVSLAEQARKEMEMEEGKSRSLGSVLTTVRERVEEITQVVNTIDSMLGLPMDKELSAGRPSCEGPSPGPNLRVMCGVLENEVNFILSRLDRVRAAL